jgi:hypothetical protein
MMEWRRGGMGNGNGPLVERSEIAIIAIAVVSAFSYVPTYVPG